jgi:hypothetical protein
MNRDDIIRLARDAGFAGWLAETPFVTASFERFAALVATTEKQKVVEYMNSRAFATGHGDTIEDLLKEMEWQVKEREREECAKLCEEIARHNEEVGCDIDLLIGNMECAAAIRARGSK